MSDMPIFGAGIWHFATYKDRYATEGYGPPVGLLEQIDKAGAVGDLSVVDLNWPFAGFDGSWTTSRQPLIATGSAPLPSRLRSTTATMSRARSPTRTRPYAISSAEAVERGD